VRRGGVISQLGYLFEGRDCHPTPPLISFASTLPLQGRVKERVTSDSVFIQRMRT
jgi:hypothetical protein